MQTAFTEEQLRDPDVARSNQVLRACVHCGFCTATCPTYKVLGDELDSPRGRIYLIKEMLENDRPADAKTVKHLDRCLSCLNCMTTCPSGVHYMHLIDHARAHIERTYRRPWRDRALRNVLAAILPYPARFRAALRAGQAGRFARSVMPDARLRAMLDMAPRSLPAKATEDGPGVRPAEGKRKMRVALMTGCAQRVLDPSINAATIRLLTRLGAEVVVADGQGCCGALVHHMGKTEAAHDFARDNIDAWLAADAEDPLDAVVLNTSGCGPTVRDYGHMLRTEPDADRAAKVSSLTRDVTEVVRDLVGDDPAAALAGDGAAAGLRVGYHSSCTLQHGQKITALPKRLLAAAGFEVLEPAESHMCCGAAGTYSLMQPEIAGELRSRKVGTLEATEPEVIAAGNIGCMTHIDGGTGLPVVHTVELLDWASGGPKPSKLNKAA